MSAPAAAPDADAPVLTADLVDKRDMLRRRLGAELGDRTFRQWLERSLAAVTPQPGDEPPVAEPRDMRPAHGPADDSPLGDAGAGAVPTEQDPGAADCGLEPCAGCNRHDADAADDPAVETGPRIRPTTQRKRLTQRWSEEDTRVLRERYAAGDHHADIAGLLERSPNSVNGQIHRLGLWEGGERRRRRRAPAVGAAAPDGPPAPAENGHDTHSGTPEAASLSDPSSGEPEADVPEAQPAPPGGCLWIEDEPGDPGFPAWCGAPRAPGRSWCPGHCRRVFARADGGTFPPGNIPA